MTLVVHELGLVTSFLDGRVRQEIRVGDNDLEVGAIRPHLYKHLAPAGSVYLRITDENGGKIADSDSVTITSLSAENYWHGKVRFLISAALRRRTTYFVELKSTGYTYAAGAFVGWCNDYDLRNIHPASYDTARGASAPLAMEVWTYGQVKNGEYPK